MGKSSFKAFNLVPAILWSLFILLVSWSVGGISLPPSIFELFSTDKAAHAIVYAILSWLILAGFSKTVQLTVVQKIGIIGWCGFYGLLMEVLQYYFFTGRYFEWMDFVANMIGAILGLAVFVFFSTFRTKFYNS